MARKALLKAIEDLQLKRGAIRSEAKAYQYSRNAYQYSRNRESGEVCVRTHNMLLQCAQLTCAIIALKGML